jgi:glycosyltransferase involved in cell wall biosynthesis
VDVTVLVATYGADEWADMAATAIGSVARQDHLVVGAHWSSEKASNPGEARNLTVDYADSLGHARAWLCFLDADDELESGFLASMATAIGPGSNTLDLWAPAVRFNDDPPVVLDDRDIDSINPCVIGTLIHRDMFERSGRFWSEPGWEDWSLFRRAWLMGATIHHVADAVYHARTDRAGRNSTVKDPPALYRRIRRTHDAWLRTQ